jgi:hypothetical protein
VPELSEPDPSNVLSDAFPDRRVFWIYSTVAFASGIGFLLSLRLGAPGWAIMAFWLLGAVCAVWSYSRLYRADKQMFRRLIESGEKSRWPVRSGSPGPWRTVLTPPTPTERSLSAWVCWAVANLVGVCFLAVSAWVFAWLWVGPR